MSDEGSKKTTITLSQKAKKRLSKFARFGEDWDAFITRVAETLEKEAKV